MDLTRGQMLEGYFDALIGGLRGLLGEGGCIADGPMCRYKAGRRTVHDGSWTVADPLLRPRS
jgi:hypothetical protein